MDQNISFPVYSDVSYNSKTGQSVIVKLFIAFVQRFLVEWFKNLFNGYITACLESKHVCYIEESIFNSIVIDRLESRFNNLQAYMESTSADMDTKVVV